MARYEYKVIPSPKRAKKAKGVKGTPARLANMLEEVMNAEAATGWEFQRAETLPVEEKSGMFSSAVETFQTVLVFRREIPGEIEDLPRRAPIAARREPEAPLPEPRNKLFPRERAEPREGSEASEIKDLIDTAKSEQRDA